MKILVCAPTAISKNYCFEAWLENVMSFTYPDFQIRLFDNTGDNGKNAEFLNNIYKNKFGDNDTFLAISNYSQQSLDENKNAPIFQKLARSHNCCKNYAMMYGYSHILHLETDVFPPKDVIERLLEQQKKVIGALYYTDSGKYRKLMVLNKIERTKNNFYFDKLAPDDDIHFADGSVKQVASVGLGCVLISREVLETIDFRWQRGVDMAPDGFFAGDCMQKGIDIFAHTALVCRHENVQWGLKNVDYKL